MTISSPWGNDHTVDDRTSKRYENFPIVGSVVKSHLEHRNDTFQKNVFFFYFLNNFDILHYCSLMIWKAMQNSWTKNVRVMLILHFTRNLWEIGLKCKQQMRKHAIRWLEIFTFRKSFLHLLAHHFKFVGFSIRFRSAVHKFSF